MKINLILTIAFFFLTIIEVYAQEQEIELFTCMPIEGKNVEFVSVSDKYRINVHHDSLALPIIENMDIDSAQYFTLDLEYRKRFLNKTGISESDKLFIYDYTSEKLVEFHVKNLNVVACLSIYQSKDDWPYDHRDYMIGFEIDKNKMVGFSIYYSNRFVYIGNKNPFVQGQLKQVEWGVIETKDFPSEEITSIDTRYYKENEYIIGQNYKYQSSDMIYYVQDLIKEKWIFAKRLIVVNRRTDEKVYETIYYSGESSSFTPLDNQWTGNLFKDMPPVIFGFQWHSFGCPGLDVLKPATKGIPINCDNRH